MIKKEYNENDYMPRTNAPDPTDSAEPEVTETGQPEATEAGQPEAEAGADTAGCPTYVPSPPWDGTATVPVETPVVPPSTPTEITLKPSVATPVTQTDKVRLASETTVQRNSKLVPVWSRYVSAVFMPLLIPAYAMALAMWLTPLSQLNENTRLGATMMILLITALAPMSYLLGMMRLGRLKSQNIILGLSNVVPSIVFVVCQGVAAFYLYRIMAPEWLIMYMVSGAVTTAVVYAIHCFTRISGHTAGMGYLIALFLYVGKHSGMDVPVTPWIMGLIVIAGVVGSARMALEKSKITPIVLGYLVGLIVTYVVMNLHFITVPPEVQQLPYNIR